MLKENQKIKPQKDDALEFVEMINKIMGIMIFQYSIKEIVFIKIKNWFDHKWLNYSGKSVIPFEFGGLKAFENRDNSALESIWRDKITVPPFNPNRVIYSKFFFKQDTGNKKMRYKLHRSRNSNDNIHNRIKDYLSDGLVIWFSSNTVQNQKGSIMAYRVQDDEVFTWYATAENQNGWNITKTKGIAINELRGYLK